MIRINVAFLQIALKIFGSRKKRELATLICSRKKNGIFTFLYYTSLVKNTVPASVQFSSVQSLSHV